ncbi:hypothetical protein QNO21_02010 [Microbacterium sp. zg-Y818]|uniref:hypothetical protein n=1 Tax=unclassified Microbacterium TaxID=2609290 RepID=UPI00214B523F|nr:MULTISPECIES: hypothetical protein [unclassified Microbacterium]MCR2801909.1 hypothetical protein [Microbacterium sp. zg.Y818]WIM22834.1 hypothetical protein QNO21_02010 [Microbacterium sp. zg-Y818]
MPGRKPDLSRATRVIAVAAVGALAVGAVALSSAALQHGTPAPATATAAPAPTFTLGPQPVASPTTDAAPPAPDAPVFTHPGAEERFLSIGPEAMWRATGGECGGTPPLVERSVDGGETWTDVTPTYRGIGQVRSLNAFAGTEAEMIADMGDDCETQYLRTFTQGRFWEPYPELLQRATYLSSTEPGVIITANGEIDAPCAAPWSFRASGGALALICDATAFRLADAEWEPVVDAAGTLALDGGDLLVAHSDTSCSGLSVTRFGYEASPEGCLESVEIRAVAAVAAGPRTLTWSGSSLRVAGD